MKKQKLFITVFTTIHWVKLAWPAEPILLTSTSLMGALPVTQAKPARKLICMSQKLPSRKKFLSFLRISRVMCYYIQNRESILFLSQY